MHEAFQAAVVAAESNQEPVLYPFPLFQDDRGWAFMNLFQASRFPSPLDSWQVNYSVLNPATIKAWHRHRRQTDFWVVLTGDMKAAVTNEKKVWTFVLGEHNPAILIIPPMLWHGCANTTLSPTGLLYLVTQEYVSASPDEERASYLKFTDEDPDNKTSFTWNVQPR